MIATGLSANYVRKGLQWVKDKAALEYLTPLTWTPKEGHRFSADPAARGRIRAVMRLGRRGWSTGQQGRGQCDSQGFCDHALSFASHASGFFGLVKDPP
ncbi:hypothetical protein [Spongiactinospora rosea]|uniref:hypothetical protein n=1 Tax=Spongiactinospora rosea TaxID=2248750 RepID=UPI0018F451FC|nr:hypothetical protein [Spongiactinospora rosea]